MIPIFEILQHDRQPICIYADGTVTGLDGDYYIQNLLPLVIRPDAAKYVQEATLQPNPSAFLSASVPNVTNNPISDTGECRPVQL